MLNLFFILLINFLSGDGERSISGQLQSYESKAPIVGASIMLEGMDAGITTDANGFFELSSPTELHVLRINAIGYCTTKIVLPLNQGNIELSEIKLFRNFNRAIMAHGTVKRKRVKNKPVYYEAQPKDLDKHSIYRTEIIPNECFSYTGLYFQYEPTFEDEVTLNLTIASTCQPN